MSLACPVSNSLTHCAQSHPSLYSSCHRLQDWAEHRELIKGSLTTSTGTGNAVVHNIFKVDGKQVSKAESGMQVPTLPTRPSKDNGHEDTEQGWWPNGGLQGQKQITGTVN